MDPYTALDAEALAQQLVVIGEKDNVPMATFAEALCVVLSGIVICVPPDNRELAIAGIVKAIRRYVDKAEGLTMTEVAARWRASMQ